MVDGYASQRMSNRFIRQLKAAGVHLHFFEPLLRSTHFYFGRRLHQKTIVVDATHALVGGVNIADRYNDLEGQDAWLDFALYLQGETAAQLHKISNDYWPRQFLSHADGLPAFTPHADHNNSYCSVRIRRNDWVKGKHEIWKTYFNLFNKADKTITILCSYFLPGRVLLKQLSMAVKRGVQVKVILAGPSDVWLAKYAERYLYDWMLKNGIRIFEYQPTVLHAKMAVADDHWVTIGSFNVNNISAYASIELNVDVRNKPFARTVQQRLDAIIENDCIEITEKNFATHATLLKRFIQRSSYEFIRLVLNLSTFYFKHE